MANSLTKFDLPQWEFDMAKQQSNWRTRKNRDGSYSWESFPIYNTKNAEKQFDIENKASAFAIHTPKVANESDLTSDEKEFIAYANTHIVKLREWFSRGVGLIKKEIAEQVREVDAEASYRALADQFRALHTSASDQFRSEYKKSKGEHEHRERELRDFRRRNRLQNRPATYPEHLPYHFALVFAAMIGEAMANSYFFGQASDVGLLGGFLTAFLVSLANVSVSMLSGFAFLRQVHHISIYRKLLGAVGFIVTLFMVGVLHVATAHYREVLTRNPDADILDFDVLQLVWETPFGFHDMESILLIGIGVVISAIAIWKGYTMDDRYPDYGPVWRRWKKIDERVNSLETSYRKSMADAYNTAVRNTSETLGRLQASKTTIEILESDVGAYLNCCKSYFETVRKGAISHINLFRSIVHDVLNDQNRFPLPVDLNEQGLEDLDATQEESTVRKMLENMKSDLAEEIESYPAKRDELLETLETERIIYTKSDYIRNLMDDWATPPPRIDSE